MKKEYYIEITLKGAETDPPYVMQSTTFETPEEAKDWFNKNWDYVDTGCLTIDLMAMVYKDKQAEEEGDYEIEFVKTIRE